RSVGGSRTRGDSPSPGSHLAMQSGLSPQAGRGEEIPVTDLIHYPQGQSMQRASMDRFIDTIEWIAAGFVRHVALDIFLSVLLRNTLNYAIPDSFDIGRMLLGILIFWGIAATSYRGTHITVDLVWANVGPRYQRIIDVFATLVLLFVVTVQTYT